MCPVYRLSARLAGLVLLLLVALPMRVLADADEPVSPNSTSLGLQPLTGVISPATPAPGESTVFQRADGAYQAIPAVRGRTKIFHIVERAAPWTLRPGLTVMANTYNGVVPGPVLLVHQGDTLVLDYTNDVTTPDSIHMHGIHGISDAMDGVAGISQSLVPRNGRFIYRFVADQPGTFIYHTHDNEAMLDSGLYGAIIVEPANARPVERGLAHDFLEMISSWQIQSAAENEFTLNGKEYPATRPLDVRSGERFRVRWVNISGEEFHTMHTHGHDQQIIARDASPVDYNDTEDTVLLGPGQRVDVAITANAKPGTWLVHCHVLDHIEDSAGMPSGLITAIHYAGTPNMMTAMYRAMTPASKPSAGGLSFGMTVVLGAIAGFTIFLGLPIARARRLSPQTVALLNALAIGILLYLVVEIAQNAIVPISQGLTAWRSGASPFPVVSIVVFVLGLLIGLVGLGSAATYVTRQAAQHAENPIVLAALIAIGIGAHNFGEGLAIGASAAAGATAVALALIVGFGLHNATEGFGVAAPLVGRVVPTWAQIGLAGLVAGGPTFIGTIVGYRFYSPTLSIFFLAIAVGALIFVIGELWSVLRRSGLTGFVTATMCAGFLLGLATELFLDINGG
ncbi:MAG: multicopper oxidase domain-containing protein [Candidatus Eremiobacteraeota bacterium]|nr:multicopper oxidase domain-containing protein [Candidatus Eremiobacteraeota bacterium]